MAADFPQGPLGMPFPHTAHVVADIVIWAVALALVVKALLEWRRIGSPLGLVLLLGGGLALFNEPVDDVLGLVWHPRPEQNTVIDTMGPVPMWGLPTYIIFFGGIPWLLLREFQKLRFTQRQFWTGIAITFALDLVIELPLLATDLYTYYADGTVPMVIAGFPLYWLLINTTGPILCATILFCAPDYFRGWRAALIVLVPVVADSACSIAVGLPVYSVLHSDTSWVIRWAGAGLSCVIGLVILDALARVIAARAARLSARRVGPALSAVDGDVGAVDPRGARGQQEGDDVGDLLRRPEPAGR